MKRVSASILALVLLLGAGLSVSGEATPPLSSGVVNKTTTIYWGKGEQFPVLATVFVGTKLDVYEYDMTWALVLYKTYISGSGEFSEHSFYGYIKRSDITCDPPLEGDASARADTGPGKKKGKRPKPAASVPPAQPSPGPTEAPKETEQPDVTVEPMEEFDWIIRTQGLRTQQVDVMGTKISCSFSLMAQKAGGSAPSSDPAFNQGIHTPYAATAFYSMKMSTADMLDDMGLSFLTGAGGFDVTLQAAGASFYIDTGAEDFALVSFTLPMQGTGMLNPSITGETGSGTIKADAGSTSVSGDSTITVQMKKSGNGYKFVLVGMRPGGGDLEYPAVLEKTFADPDRFDKEASDADVRRKKAEAERDRMLDEMKKKAEAEAKATEDPLAPLTPTEDPLAPLTPLGDDSLAPLAPLTPLGDDSLAPLAPLTPLQEDEAPPFPGSPSGCERRGALCA